MYFKENFKYNLLVFKSSMVKNKFCSGCKKSIRNISGSASFKCPSCGKYEMIRCDHCRKISTRYTCPECNFEGP